jgi:hypothetical protein
MLNPLTGEFYRLIGHARQAAFKEITGVCRDSHHCGKKVLLKRREIRYITHQEQEKDKIENKITKNTSGEVKWKI